MRMRSAPSPAKGITGTGAGGTTGGAGGGGVMVKATSPADNRAAFQPVVTPLTSTSST